MYRYEKALAAQLCVNGRKDGFSFFIFACLVCVEDLWDSICECVGDVGLFRLAERKLRKDAISTSRHYQ